MRRSGSQTESMACWISLRKRGALTPKLLRAVMTEPKAPVVDDSRLTTSGTCSSNAVSMREVRTLSTWSLVMPVAWARMIVCGNSTEGISSCLSWVTAYTPATESRMTRASVTTRKRSDSAVSPLKSDFMQDPIYCDGCH